MNKIKEFYHKYDYKMNGNSILETIIQSIFILIVILFIFFTGNKDVKAESFNFYPNITNFGGIYSFNNNGSSVTGGRYATSTFNDTSDFYAYSDIGVYNYQTNGAILNFNLSEPLEKDNRYVMSFYFGANTNVIKGTMPNFVRPITNITDSPFSYPSNSVEIKSSKCTSDPGDLIGVFGYSSKCLVDFVYKGTYETSNLSLSINLQNKGNALIHVYGYNMQKLAKDYTTELNTIENTINNFNNSLNQNKNDIMNNQNSNTTTIIDNQNQNKDDIINGVNQNFQNCRDSINLFNKSLAKPGFVNNQVNASNSWSFLSMSNLEPDHSYFINKRAIIAFYNDNVVVKVLDIRNTSFKVPSNVNKVYISVENTNINEFQLEKGTKFTQFEEYGKQVCTNKIDDSTDKIIDSIQGDGLDTDNINPSQNDTLDDYKDAESKFNFDGLNLNDINLGLNSKAAAKIWSILQTFLDTNSKLLGYIISMLSVGLIKLFLGR